MDECTQDVTTYVALLDVEGDEEDAALLHARVTSVRGMASGSGHHPHVARPRTPMVQVTRLQLWMFKCTQ